MIQKVALRPGDYRIADGSGLSLYNYVSAELETRLLRSIWKRPKLFERLYDSLPIAAVDGTLKKRMLNGYAAGNVHAKTGSVSGISSLAGYCTAANGHELCFSIINQGIMHMADGRDLQDQLCEIMCK
jgi:D-alanyl-D-alanine carboxypeptidase/D-alanyl-D-alanine-endopeptidase (penicillin-binding protein 4)